MIIHHNLDIKPIPEEVLYINEPELIDASYGMSEIRPEAPDSKPDNVRVYVPLDLNADAIMRRLRLLVYRYGEANEENEMDFSLDVGRLISQIEIYDQVWSVRGQRRSRQNDHGKGERNELTDHGVAGSERNGNSGIRRHSAEAIELVKRFVAELEEIPDGCAETFPFEVIEELRGEYGLE